MTKYTIGTAGGDVYAHGMEDLGDLKAQAERMAVRCHAGTYTIEANREPWGKLRIVGPDSWEIRSDDGKTVVIPSAFIL